MSSGVGRAPGLLTKLISDGVVQGVGCRGPRPGQTGDGRRHTILHLVERAARAEGVDSFVEILAYKPDLGAGARPDL